jgi:hypothetical protein
MADGGMTEMAAAMVDGDWDSNGLQQGQGRWVATMAMAMATATGTTMAMAMTMATAMATVMVTESSMVTVTKMEMAIVIATATARATMTKGGLPFHVLAMCSTVAGATPCLHPHGHKGVCIHQRCIIGVTLQKGFAPFQRG